MGNSASVFPFGLMRVQCALSELLSKKGHPNDESAHEPYAPLNLIKSNNSAQFPLFFFVRAKEFNFQRERKVNSPLVSFADPLFHIQFGVLALAG